MSNFLKVTVFSLLVIGLYTLFSAGYVPPINPGEPPRDEEAAAGSMPAQELAALGEKVFNGKGACALCHNPVGDRAPLLDGIFIKAGERIKDPAYRGKAANAYEYVYESMTEPSAYVVKGYAMPGAENKSPMPAVSSGEIGLNDTEISAVAAYLQKISGVEVTAAPLETPSPLPERAQ